MYMYSYKGQSGTGAGSIRAKNIEDHVHATDSATGGEESSCFLNNYCEWSRDWQGTHITNQKVSNQQSVVVHFYICMNTIVCDVCVCVAVNAYIYLLQQIRAYVKLVHIKHIY